MDISLRWLRALAAGLTDDAVEAADRLAMYGAPVDEVIRLGESLGDIRIARVVEAGRHPNADRLSLCRVDAGTGELLSVVCGAPNVRAGAYYPFAPVGATLPGGITIRKAKIRGETSEGMLCSERELGLGRDHAGIMELHGEFEPGAPFLEAVGLDDARLVVDVTANRPDLLSHIGVARELAPGGVAGIELPAFPGGEATVGEAALPARRVGREGVVGGVRVRIEDPAGCPRYLAAVVRGVRVGPSPEWLASRLRAVGQRPINNIVDATNYVLHELGQPLHAFDLDRLAGPAIVVRRAAAGERMRTLDGVERSLAADMVVIADADRAVAVAGVMGGEESEVTAETRDVLLECALFEPKSIRRTRRALGLSTDASYRFERGVDPEGMELAARRAVALIVAVAGGTPEDVLLDVNPSEWQAPVVELRPARVAHVLGTELAEEEIVSLLEPIGFRVEGRMPAGALRVRVPGYRSYDVSREIDLIEEIARRRGYGTFGEEAGAYRPGTVPPDPLAGLEARLRELLVARGFLEARGLPFAPEAEGDVVVLNPLSATEGRLRRALVPGLLRRLEYNFARGQRHIRLFEIGTVFAPAPDGRSVPAEATRVAAVMTGARTPPHWSEQVPAYDLWDLKGVLAEVARELAGGEVEVAPVAGDVDGLPFATAFRATAAGVAIGSGGLVQSSAVDAPPWADPVYALELELRPEMAQRRAVTFTPLPAFPAIERDVALLVPDAVEAARVEAAIRHTGGELLEAVFPFDVYRGKGIPERTRSIAYRLRFRAMDRTLTDAQADRALNRVLRQLREELGVERRG